MLVYYLYFNQSSYLFLKHIFLGVTNSFKQIRLFHKPNVSILVTA